MRLRNGKEIKASKAVVSNASIWDTLNLIPQGVLPQSFVAERENTPECESFMHLHLGIDATGLEDLECHYIVVNDWDKGITAPQNVIVMSIPSVLDPSLAPPGKHGIHVYTPGNEPYEIWAGMDRRSEAYQQLKQGTGRSDVASTRTNYPRCQKSHRTKSNRHTPGPTNAISVGIMAPMDPHIERGKPYFLVPQLPLAGLLCCGDSTFPGIGIPAVAASGAIRS